MNREIGIQPEQNGSIFADKKSFVKSSLRLIKNTMLYITVRTENKCSGETEMLHELVHDTTRKSESHELINSRSIMN